MDHEYIEQFDIVDRYVMGKLPAQESERFEEHFLDCPQCIDRVQTTSSFRQGLRAWAAQQVTSAERPPAQSWQAPFWQRIPGNVWALTTCGLLLAILLISIFALRQIRDLQQQAAHWESAAADWRQRFETEQPASSPADGQRQQAEQELQRQVQQLEEALQVAQKREFASRSRRRSQPGVNPPIVVLNSVRASGQNLATVPEIVLSSLSTDFIVSLPLEGEGKYSRYRAVIYAKQRQIWETDQLKPNAYNALTITFPPSFFLPGDYSIVIEGIPPTTGALDSTVIGNYPLRVRE